MKVNNSVVILNILLNLILYIISFLCILGSIGFLFFNVFSIDMYNNFYDPKLDELRDRLTPYIPEIQYIKLSGSNKSFTINKKHIYICTKDENNEYYDDNMLIYVLLHEMAHVLCDEVGHTEKYRNIFRGLLKKAANAGVYDPSKPPVEDYCSF